MSRFDDPIHVVVDEEPDKPDEPSPDTTDKARR